MPGCRSRKPRPPRFSSVVHYLFPPFRQDLRLATLAEMPRRFGSTYMAEQSLSAPEAKVWRAIVACRTAVLGRWRVAPVVAAMPSITPIATATVRNVALVLCGFK